MIKAICQVRLADGEDVEISGTAQDMWAVGCVVVGMFCSGLQVFAPNMLEAAPPDFDDVDKVHALHKIWVSHRMISLWHETHTHIHRMLNMSATSTISPQQSSS